jgi:hypothetical protein
MYHLERQVNRTYAEVSQFASIKLKPSTRRGMCLRFIYDKYLCCPYPHLYLADLGLALSPDLGPWSGFDCDCEFACSCRVHHSPTCPDLDHPASDGRLWGGHLWVLGRPLNHSLVCRYPRLFQPEAYSSGEDALDPYHAIATCIHRVHLTALRHKNDDHQRQLGAWQAAYYQDARQVSDRQAEVRHCDDHRREGSGRRLHATGSCHSHLHFRIQDFRWRLRRLPNRYWDPCPLCPLLELVGELPSAL